MNRRGAPTYKGSGSTEEEDAPHVHLLRERPDEVLPYEVDPVLQDAIAYGLDQKVAFSVSAPSGVIVVTKAYADSDVVIYG